MGDYSLQEGKRQHIPVVFFVGSQYVVLKKQGKLTSNNFLVLLRQKSNTKFTRRLGTERTLTCDTEIMYKFM